MGMLRWEAEVVVVGTGPGGATVARELARAGRRVLLLERGGPERGRPLYGTHLGALRYTERGGLFFTPEGIQVVAPRMVGGATGMFAGCAAPPPDWLRTKYGIDLRQEVAETIEELGIAPLPPEHRGAASTRLAEAARALGYAVYPQPKFIRPERAPRFRCGAHCLLGCRCGAKWSAAEFVEEAVRAGALLLPYAFVERVLLEGGRAVGVAGRIRGQPFIARADQVVLAAGGLGTPRILQASGFRGIGEGLAMDLTVIVYGRSRTDGNASDPPMTWSWEDPGLEVMFSTLMDPWLLYPLVAGMSGLRHVATWPRWRHARGDDQAPGCALRPPPPGWIPLEAADPDGSGPVAGSRGHRPTHPGRGRRGSRLDLRLPDAGDPSERHRAHRGVGGRGPADGSAGALRLRRQRVPGGAGTADGAHPHRPGQAPGPVPG